jgi:uncharacterized membrane protein YvlD (DUF360 family)
VTAFRAPANRPSWTRVLFRGVVVTLTTALALWILAALIDGFTIDHPWDAILAGFVVGVLNAAIWPMLAIIVVPISVLTLGIGAIVLDVVVVGLILDALPGITLHGFWTALLVVLGLVVVSTVTSTLLAIDDDSWFDRAAVRRARRRAGAPTVTDVPGVVFIQIDGLAKVVLERALRSGDAPTLHRWLHDGSHLLTGWETGWSSQTGVSQCGILHGSVEDMPAFRWLDRSTGQLVVSNRPASAAAIERRHSDGNGLLAHHGSSYNNLFSGDAERAVLTMSGAGRRKEGRIGAGYFGYFTKPDQAIRTLLGIVGEVWRERRAALQQRRRGVEPRVRRGWTYTFLRAFTTVVSRDVCVQGVVNDMGEGRAAIYIDMLGYDEVAHHSGPERVDTLAVLRDIDRSINRIDHARAWAPRPYRIVVLSDHGQTQGPTFAQRTGQTLAQVVGDLCGGAMAGDPDADAGKTESSAWLRQARDSETDTPAVTATSSPIVLGSGTLGLIFLPGATERLTREEIDARYPKLISGLIAHPLIGFVLVRTAAGDSVVLGAEGERNLATGELLGANPLAPFGPRALAQVSEVDGYTTTADLMINAAFDPDLQEISAFEEQVSSHGGLGGPQTHPFLLHPADLTLPSEPIFRSPAVHRVLKEWLADLGHPVTTTWRENGSPRN